MCMGAWTSILVCCGVWRGYGVEYVIGVGLVRFYLSAGRGVNASDSDLWGMKVVIKCEGLR